MAEPRRKQAKTQGETASQAIARVVYKAVAVVPVISNSKLWPVKAAPTSEHEESDTSSDEFEDAVSEEGFEDAVDDIALPEAEVVTPAAVVIRDVQEDYTSDLDTSTLEDMLDLSRSGMPVAWPRGMDARGASLVIESRKR